MKRIIPICFLAHITLLALLLGTFAGCEKMEQRQVIDNSLTFHLNGKPVIMSNLLPISATYYKDEDFLKIFSLVSSNGVRYELNFTIPTPSEGLTIQNKELVKFCVFQEERSAEISSFKLLLKDFKLNKKTPSYVSGSFEFCGTLPDESTIFNANKGKFYIELTKK